VALRDAYSEIESRGVPMPGKFHIPLTPQRQAVAAQLQAMLVDLIDKPLWMIRAQTGDPMGVGAGRTRVQAHRSNGAERS
jgi:hypothetical protein